MPVDRWQWLGLPDRQERLSEGSTCVCRTRRRPECGWTTKAAAAAALDFGSHPKQREVHQNIRDGEGNLLRLLWFIFGCHFELKFVMVCCWPNPSSTFDCDEAGTLRHLGDVWLAWISPFSSGLIYLRAVPFRSFRLLGLCCNWLCCLSLFRLAICIYNAVLLLQHVLWW